MARAVTLGELGVVEGQVLLGKYRVDRVLGRGGMGIVVLATHLGLDERVAIKFLRSDVGINPMTRARFKREAQATFKLKSEHVVKITDVGVFESGVPYMVMEYLDGSDLDQLIEAHGVVEPALAIELVMQACVALAEAHSVGIVHRDIKPSNLFVTHRPDGSRLLKVLDFGISKVEVGADLALTATQTLLGTPAYMAPEQMASARAVDPRSDIWSLGTVLYELLEGERPFTGETFAEMCVKVIKNPPRPMVAGAPRELEAIVLRCLEKDPDQRYATIADLAFALAPLTASPGQGRSSADRMQRVLERRPTPNPAAGSQPSGRRPGDAIATEAAGATAWLGPSSPTTDTTAERPIASAPASPATMVLPVPDSIDAPLGVSADASVEAAPQPPRALHRIALVGGLILAGVVAMLVVGFRDGAGRVARPDATSRTPNPSAADPRGAEPATLVVDGSVAIDAATVAHDLPVTVPADAFAATPTGVPVDAGTPERAHPITRPIKPTKRPKLVPHRPAETMPFPERKPEDHAR